MNRGWISFQLLASLIVFSGVLIIPESGLARATRLDRDQELVAQQMPVQKPTDQDREAKAALAMLSRQEIPEATLPCTPGEAEWWEELRTLGNKARRSGGKGADKFFRLLKEGLGRTYQAPIPNRGPTFLRKAPPEYTEEARREQISGSIALVVEFLEDGTVGEVRIVQGLGFGLDEKATEAARKTIFLPAVRDGKFVSLRLPMTMSFSLSGFRVRQ